MPLPVSWVSMRIKEAPGLHYCTDCGVLVIDEEHDSVWYCDKCAFKRGANIIDGRPIKIENNKRNSQAGEGSSPIETGEQTTQG
jgi:Zn finger protein HypA/HybF involved in hydrogenase expression